MSEETMSMEELDDAVEKSFDTFKDDDNVWVKMKKAMDEKEVLTVTTDKTAVKGGVTVTVDGKRAFIPASQLALTRVDNLEDYQGKELQVRVIEVSEEKNRLIFSSKAVLRDSAKADAEARLNAIEPGTVLEGTVDSIKPYGAFIKIDEYITGLVHVSQISAKRIKDPSVVLKEGETVKVKVLNVKDGKLSLSIKALTAPQAEEETKSEDTELRHVKIPKAEPLVQNMGDLLKGFKLN